MSATDAILEPGLTKHDKRVLKAIPAETEELAGPALTVWQIGEVLDALDLTDLMRTLRGLEHLGYAYTIRMLPGDHWRRTEKGEEALA